MATFTLHTCEGAGVKHCSCPTVTGESARLTYVITAKDGSVVRSVPFDSVTGLERRR
jgi:hypothetical protein